MSIKVLVYEDNVSLASSLQTWMQLNEEIDLLGIISNPQNILAELKALGPDVILMDIDMPMMTGIDALKLARKHHLTIPVIMLTVFDDDQNIIEAIQSGANGYILKKNFDNIIPSIKDVLAGGAPMSSFVARRVLELFARKSKPNKEADYHLTARETEILNWLVQGYSYKMIADKTNTALDTVRNHIKSIYRKMEVNSATEAVYKYQH